MPLQRRIPKRGFTNIHRVEYQVVNVRDLSRVDAGEVTPESLHEAGLIRSASKPVKVLGQGEVEGAFRISAHAFSGTAKEKIEAAGGTVTVIQRGSPAEAAEETAPEQDAPAPETSKDEEA
jgi:large subunit ribosomal protein L15